MPTLVKVAMPATALLVKAPTVIALLSPLLTVIVTEAVLLVTVLPAESLMVMIGCVVKAEPLGLPNAGVVSVAWVAVPKVGVMVCVATVNPVEVKVRV